MKTKEILPPLFFTFVLTAIDQLSKYLAIQNLMDKADIIALPYILRLTYHTNSGAAFGLFQGGRWFFLIFASIVFIGIGYYYLTMPDGKIYSWSKALLVITLSGALGNSIDRLLNGYVVDFLCFEFIDFPIFNIADIYVVTGTLLLGVTVFFFMEKEQSPEEGEK